MPIDTPEATGPAAAAQRLPQRLLLLARVQIPGRHLDAPFGHEVAANARQRGKDLPRVRERPRRAPAARELADDVPRRLGGLAAVVRVVLGDALAPAVCAAPVDRTSRKWRSYERPKLVSKW